MTLKQALAKGYGLTSWRGNGLPDGYFPHWEYNVYGNYMEKRFIEMFTRGSGCELDFKGAAVHSSSMFGYNFFHWISDDNRVTFEINKTPVTVSHVGFEARMKTLPSSNAPANMDVLLASEKFETVVFIESKLLEYNSHSAFDISDSYCDCSKYYENEDDGWSGFIRNCRQEFSKGNEYYEGIKQNICHLIAIRNLACGQEKAMRWFKDQNKSLGIDLSRAEHIYFVNAIFDPSKEYANECEAYKKYRELNESFIKKVEEANLLPGNLKCEFIPYSSLWKQFAASMPEDVSAFLYRRYMAFSAAVDN